MLFYKQYVCRRFEASVYVKGHSTSTYEEKPLQADIQTLENHSSTSQSGAESKQRIKIFSQKKLKIADKNNGVRADWIWFQGKWFEVVSCRLSENTMLKHYTSQAEEVLNAENEIYRTKPAIAQEDDGEEGEF